MYMNNTFSDEELSFYEFNEDDFNLINPNLNQSLEEKNNQEHMKKMNDDKYDEAFEKEFKNLFIKNNKGNSIHNKEITPYIEKENSIKKKKKILKKKY